jgi:hypothetical protein
MRSPLRDLTREGVPLLLLSSCRADQSALEPKKKGAHGFFTRAILDAVDDAGRAKGKRRGQAVRADELRDAIVRRLPELLGEYKVSADEQVPEFLPLRLTGDAVLCKP